MRVGDFVTNVWHGTARYGKIREVLRNLKGDNWSYFLIDWFDDEKYQKTVEHIRKTSGREYEPEYYRADQIHCFDVDKTIQTLKKLQNSAE